MLESIPFRRLSCSEIDGFVDSKKIEFAKGIFLSLAEDPEQDTEETGTLVLSTTDSTRVLTLLDPGWIVDREIDHMILWSLVPLCGSCSGMNMQSGWRSTHLMSLLLSKGELSERSKYVGYHYTDSGWRNGGWYCL